MTRRSGIGLVQLLISITIGAIIIAAFLRLTITLTKKQVEIQRLQSFEDIKLNLKLALQGCDYGFQNTQNQPLTFNTPEPTLIGTIMKKNRPLLAVDQKLQDGSKVTSLELTDTGVPVQSIEGTSYNKYFAKLTLTVTTVGGQVLKLDPHILLAITTDSVGKIEVCPQPPERQVPNKFPGSKPSISYRMEPSMPE